MFNAKFGSHLYGLERPESDTDYKGIYVPKLKEVIMARCKHTVEYTSDTVDTSYYSIGKFVTILSKNDTVSMDMLHTPNQFVIQKDTHWEAMQANRADVYCKNMRGLLGYIKTMSSKYGHKAQRREEITELLGLMEHLEDHVKISQTTLPEQVMRAGFKYIKFTPHHENIIANIDVCGGRHQITSSVYHLKQALQSNLKQFGRRTKATTEQGGDWKSLSHALRVLIQLEEIIDTRDLIFPLIRKDEIMKVKLGQVPHIDVISNITDAYDRVIEKLESSDLPEHNNMARFEDILMSIYKDEEKLESEIAR
jgi:predicted nucleotidyltransferase